MFCESGLPPSESLLRTVLHQRNEAEFEFKVQTKVKSHFNYLKNDKTSTYGGSGTMPNVNIDSSFKKQNEGINVNQSKNNIKSSSPDVNNAPSTNVNTNPSAK